MLCNRRHKHKRRGTVNVFFFGHLDREGNQNIPVWGRIREVDPRLPVPKDHPTVGDAGVGPPAVRVEDDALGALDLVKELNLRLL